MKSSYIYLFIAFFCSFLGNMALAQSVSPTNLLMLDYSAYDPFYVEKIEEIIQKNLPDVAVNHFSSGTPLQLSEELEGINYVVIPYPSKGSETLLNEYGKSLKSFLEKGGVVVCTGTHEYTYINAFKLLDVYYGRYCLAPKVEMGNQANYFTENLVGQFDTQNFGYALDVFDPLFTQIATLDGRALVGVKNIGSGAFIYIGLEYFYDEPASTKLLINALHWKKNISWPTEILESVKPSSSAMIGIKSPMALTELENLGMSAQSLSDPASYDFDFLPTHSDQPNMRVYPNPFSNYTIADIELRKTTKLTIRVYNNLGQIVVTPVTNEILDPGKYKYKLTNLPEGTYRIEYDCNGEITWKTAIKILRP